MSSTFTDLAQFDVFPVQTFEFSQVDGDELELAEKTTKSSGKSSESSPFVEFGIGCFLIPFAFALLWKNEKKLVTYTKCIATAKKECVPIDTEKPIEDNDMALVHCTGKTRNE